MRYAKTLLAAGLVLALSAPLAAADDYGKDKSKHEKEMTSIEGKVQRVWTKTVEEQPIVYLELKTEKEPKYTVCLGEKPTDDEKKIDLANGDAVKLKGKKTKLENGDVVFVAYEIRQGDNKWMLDHDEDLHKKMKKKTM